MTDLRGSAPRATSRRIGGSQTAQAQARRGPSSAWQLKLLAVAFAWPAAVRLLGFDTIPAIAIVLAIGLMWVASDLITRGLAVEAELAGRVLAQAPKLPSKLVGSLLVALAAICVSLGAAHDPLLMALLFGGLTFLGCRLAYGADARTDRDSVAAAAKRAGMTPSDVLIALDEANRKIREIETSAGNLHARELVDRLRRITMRARAVLAQIETDPRDISRARRFLVTYLDGTKDVVAKYAQQQKDLADTPLAENFRKVLETVEQVFAEQEELLKRDEKLDLEVQLEVLETQLKREGVH